MLVDVQIANFRSIREPQELSLVGGVAKERRNILRTADFDSSVQLVPFAALYGANASGKTNFIYAVEFMQNFVLKSANESQHGDKIPIEPFVFDSTGPKQPSEFIVTVSINQQLYEYGFSADENRVHKEWLNVYVSRRAQRWFCRQYDLKTKTYHWEFSKYFKGRKKIWKDATRDNALFLSTAVQLNNEQLMPVFSWFKNDLIVLSKSHDIPFRKTVNKLFDEKSKAQVCDYLSIADNSIEDIHVSEKDLSEDFLSLLQRVGDLSEKEKYEIAQTKKMIKTEFVHKGNKKIAFQNESLGTQRLFALAGYWLDVLNKGKVLFFDELESSLHLLLAKHLILLFSSYHKNKKNAQLIFTTHNVSFLNKEVFRRDQIWFTEKDEKQATQLYSLAEFKQRNDQAFDKNYLLGVYGALPFIVEDGE